MSSAGAPDPSPSRAPSVRRALRVALARGAFAFLVVGIVGELAGLAVAAVSPLRLASFPKVGAFEFALVNGVPLVARARLALGGSGSFAPPPISARIELGATLLLGTSLAAWLLYRGGRAAADALGGEGSLARVAAGAAVAVPYATLAFAVAWLVELRISMPGVLASGSVQARSLPALLLPLLLGVIAGAVGGLRSATARSEDASLRRAEAVLAGGWRMLLLGLAFSYVGLFVAGVVEPDGFAAWLTPTTDPYLRAVARHPGVGTVVVVHQLVAAPNEAIWTLVPAMGGCDVLSGAAGGSRPFACYGRIPVGVARPSLVSLLAGPSSVGLRFAKAPWPVYLFLLAPGAATVMAGAWTARRGGSGSGREAAVLGAGAGVVFAVVVGAVGWLASVRLAIEITPRLIGTGAYRIGPELVSGGALALAWGVVGGALGGAIATRSRPLSR